MNEYACVWIIKCIINTLANILPQNVVVLCYEYRNVLQEFLQNVLVALHTVA